MAYSTYVYQCRIDKELISKSHPKAIAVKGRVSKIPSARKKEMLGLLAETG